MRRKTTFVMVVSVLLFGCESRTDPPPKSQTNVPKSQPNPSPQRQSPAPSSVDKEDERSGEELFATGKHAQALAVFQQRLKTEPNNQTLLYNTGLSAYLVEKYDDARQAWLALEKFDGDWKLVVKEKLIQTYAKLDQPKEVQQRIAELVKIRQRTDDPEYQQKRSFCRDQFILDDDRFILHHHFDFPVKDEVKFTAYCAGADGEIKHWFRFWSSSATNQMAREMEELKDGERLYHLDEYHHDGSKINHLHTKESLPFPRFRKIIIDKSRKK